jgi:hypothetical protein
MKKLIFLTMMLVLCSSLFAQNITSTTVKVSGNQYSCYGSTHTSFAGSDLGDISSLALNGSVRVSSDWSASSANMYYRLDGGSWTTVLLDKRLELSDDNFFAKILSVSTIYSSSNNITVNTHSLTNGDTYTLDIYHELSGTTVPSEAPDSYYSATFTKIAAIDFTDGSSFSPTVSEGSSDQAIGRFYLTADVTGASLTAASVTLNGTRTGISNIRLWSSADAVFDGDGTDTQLGSAVESDPVASPADFSGFTSSIATGGTYYFVTADVAADATGSIRGEITDNDDLTVSSGELNTTVSSAQLSDSDVACPICLDSFHAEAGNGKVELYWTTASETENSHFLIYRDDAGHRTDRRRGDRERVAALLLYGQLCCLRKCLYLRTGRCLFRERGDQTRRGRG